MDNLKELNSLPLFLITGSIVFFVMTLSAFFMFKSYRAGISIGMDKKTLKRAITSSATFTILPSISILLGVIALSGTLGIPLPWVRLSVIGALHYETTVADIAARSVGLTGLAAKEMTFKAFTTIALLMTTGIMLGVFLCIFSLKKYLGKISSKPKTNKSGKSFSDVMMIAMFIGLISAYIGSYIGVYTSTGDLIPIISAVVSALIMAIFVYFTEVKKMSSLDNFSIATSMLVGMIAAVLCGIII